jgi:hypothetical protein
MTREQTVQHGWTIRAIAAVVFMVFAVPLAYGFAERDTQGSPGDEPTQMAGVRLAYHQTYETGPKPGSGGGKAPEARYARDTEELRLRLAEFGKKVDKDIKSMTQAVHAFEQRPRVWLFISCKVKTMPGSWKKDLRYDLWSWHIDCCHATTLGTPYFLKCKDKKLAFFRRLMSKDGYCCADEPKVLEQELVLPAQRVAPPRR